MKCLWMDKSTEEALTAEFAMIDEGTAEEATKTLKKATLMSWGQLAVSVMSLATVVALHTGCENDHNTVIVATNTVVNVSGGNGGDGGNGGNGGDGGNGGNTPAPTPQPPANNPDVTVMNNSSHGVTVNGALVASGGSKSWHYSGSTTVTYDTLAGYSVSQTVNDGKSWDFTIYDSASVAGTVEMSGNAL